MWVLASVLDLVFSNQVLFKDITMLIFTKENFLENAD